MPRRPSTARIVAAWRITRAGAQGVGAVWSLASAGSIRSISSTGSILSVGSAGSILSVGSAGSILSIGSAGSILSIGSAGSMLSFASRKSVLSIRSTEHILHDHDEPISTSRLLTLIAGTTAAVSVMGFAIVIATRPLTRVSTS